MSAVTAQFDQQVMSRAEVASVLAMVAHYRGQVPGEADVRAWRAALAGYSVGECHAAVLAAGKFTDRITPAEIIERIKAARRLTEARTPRRRPTDNDRALFAAAGRRGIAAVYAAAGWQRQDTTQATDALTRTCPACGALPGITCRRAARIRNGIRETSDLRSRAHPSRLTAASPTATDTPGGTT
jgi:hypothetical protein